MGDGRLLGSYPCAQLLTQSGGWAFIRYWAFARDFTVLPAYRKYHAQTLCLMQEGYMIDGLPVQVLLSNYLVLNKCKQTKVKFLGNKSLLDLLNHLKRKMMPSMNA